MDEDDLYDEFGNYIGPELDSDDDGAPDVADDDDNDDEPEEEEEETGGGGGDVAMRDGGDGDGGDDDTRVVLHEDKKYYPTAMEVYGEEVETTIQEEDTQPLTEPIVAPLKPKAFDVVEKKRPSTRYSDAFLFDMMRHPTLVRNVAVIGHLGHGKTTLLDGLVAETHVFDEKRAVVNAEAKARELERQLNDDRRYTDARVDEQQRGLSIKATPMTLLLQGASEKHYLFNLIDTPGHVNFSDEVVAGLRLADGALVVVDAVEGVMLNTERTIRAAVAQRLPVMLFVNKLDRLVLELKIPPQDAYFKLRQVIDEVNAVVASASGGAHPPLSPEDGSVVFGASSFRASFSLASFANIYAEFHEGLDAAAFARRLWGDVYYQPDTRGFRRKPPEGGGPRTFVQFILEPFYKLVAQASSLPDAARPRAPPSSDASPHPLFTGDLRAGSRPQGHPRRPRRPHAQRRVPIGPQANAQARDGALLRRVVRRVCRRDGALAAVARRRRAGEDRGDVLGGAHRVVCGRDDVVRRRRAADGQPDEDVPQA